MGQTNEQQLHFNKWPISELHGEVDSIQTSLKQLFTSQQQWNVVSAFQLSGEEWTNLLIQIITTYCRGAYRNGEGVVSTL